MRSNIQPFSLRPSSALILAAAWIFLQPLSGCCAPTALVTGNFFEINNGQTTTALLNLTDYGAVSVSNTQDLPPDYTYLVRNLGVDPLHITGPITFTGAGAESFVLVNQPSPGDEILTSTFANIDVIFDPISTATGTQTAMISIPTDDPDQTTYTFTVTGFGSSEDIPAEVDLRIQAPKKFFQTKCDKLGVCRLKAKMPVINDGNTDLTSGVLRVYLCKKPFIDEDAVQLEDAPFKKVKAPKVPGGHAKFKKIPLNAVMPNDTFSFYFLFVIPSDGHIENNMQSNIYGIQFS